MTLELATQRMAATYGVFVAIITGGMSYAMISNNDACLALSCTPQSLVSELQPWVSSLCGALMIASWVFPQWSSKCLFLLFWVVTPMAVVASDYKDDDPWSSVGVARLVFVASITLLPAFVLALPAMRDRMAQTDRESPVDADDVPVGTIAQN